MTTSICPTIPEIDQELVAVYHSYAELEKRVFPESSCCTYNSPSVEEIKGITDDNQTRLWNAVIHLDQYRLDQIPTPKNKRAEDYFIFLVDKIVAIRNKISAKTHTPLCQKGYTRIFKIVKSSITAVQNPRKSLLQAFTSTMSRLGSLFSRQSH